MQQRQEQNPENKDQSNSDQNQSQQNDKNQQQIQSYDPHYGDIYFKKNNYFPAKYEYSEVQPIQTKVTQYVPDYYYGYRPIERDELQYKEVRREINHDTIGNMMYSRLPHETNYLLEENTDYYSQNIQRYIYPHPIRYGYSNFQQSAKNYYDKKFGQTDQFKYYRPANHYYY